MDNIISENLEKLLEDLPNLRNNIRFQRVDDFFNTQGNDPRGQFVPLRREITVEIGKLENAQLKDIERRLKELSVGLRAGCEDLQAKIDALNNAVAILEAMGRFLAVLKRLAILFA